MGIPRYYSHIYSYNRSRAWGINRRHQKPYHCGGDGGCEWGRIGSAGHVGRRIRFYSSGYAGLSSSFISLYSLLHFSKYHGPGYDDEKAFRSELEIARKILQEGRDNQASGNIPDSGASARSDADGHGGPLAIGAGFLGWKLDETDGKSAALLSIALDARVSAVWLSFGNDLGHWVDVVRRADAARAKPHKTLVFILVNSVQDARKAVEDWHADILVAQGTLFFFLLPL